MSEFSTTEVEETFTSDNPSESNFNENDENIDRVEDVTEEEENDGQQKTSKAATKSTSDDIDNETEEEDDEMDMQGDDPGERNRKIPLAYQYRIPRAERLVDPNAPNEPT
jgi:hypothetical protein